MMRMTWVRERGWILPNAYCKAPQIAQKGLTLVAVPRKGPFTEESDGSGPERPVQIGYGVSDQPPLFAHLSIVALLW
jgi:hypothetical protein